MKLSTRTFFLACCSTSIVSAATPLQNKNATNKPAFFILAGDSTTAVRGGWGEGFLDFTVKSPASGINFGHSGATTVSYKNGGDWNSVLSNITSHKTDYDVFVTIQFGHNDQKATANISIEQYKSNLGHFVEDVRGKGGEPILFTSLTRRGFAGDPPRIVEDLAEQRNATIEVAEAEGSKWIDLNLASENYCNAIGEQASWKYNLVNATKNGDRTHLNDWGSVVFGRLVSDLLVAKYPGTFEEWTLRNETLTSELEEGIPA